MASEWNTNLVFSHEGAEKAVKDKAEKVIEYARKQGFTLTGGSTNEVIAPAASVVHESDEVREQREQLEAQQRETQEAAEKQAGEEK